MNEIQIFKFEETAAIRTIVDKDGKIWFVAKDICDALDLVDSTSAIRTLKENYRLIGVDIKEVFSKHPLETAGGKQEMTTVSEVGLYDLVQQSRKLTALKFKHWISSEVLPEIRKTGSYNAPQFNLPKDFPSALRMLADSEEAKALLIQERDAANLKIEQDKPKIDSFNKFLETDGTYTLTNAFKLLGEKPNIGMAVLRKYKILYQRHEQNIPSQIYLDKGIFVLKAVTNSTNKKSYPQTRVTPEGVAWLRSKYPVLIQNEISLARH